MGREDHPVRPEFVVVGASYEKDVAKVSLRDRPARGRPRAPQSGPSSDKSPSGGPDQACRPGSPPNPGLRCSAPRFSSALPSPRSLRGAQHPHTKRLTLPERPAQGEPPQVSTCRRGGRTPELPHPGKNLCPKGRSVLLSRVRYPSLPRPRLPSTSRAMSDGNNMTEAAAGTATGDEIQVKANTATAPAPHLPVPVAALNPRQFVPPLSPRVRQSLPPEKERRRNETRLRSPRNCRHFRPPILRGGAEGGEEVGRRRSGRSQGAGSERKDARHWRVTRRSVCSEEPNVLRRASARTQSVRGSARMS